MTLPSQPWLVARTSRAAEPGAKAPPSALSWRTQKRVGVLPGMPSLFQMRYGTPVVGSTNGCGSMEPFGSTSQCDGPEVPSTNGPSGAAEVATDRQNRWLEG